MRVAKACCESGKVANPCNPSQFCALSIGVPSTSNPNDLNNDSLVTSGGRMNSDCQSNIKSEFAIAADSYIKFSLPFLSMLDVLVEKSMNTTLNNEIEVWVLDNNEDRSIATYIELVQEDPSEELGIELE